MRQLHDFQLSQLGAPSVVSGQLFHVTARSCVHNIKRVCAVWDRRAVKQQTEFARVAGGLRVCRCHVRARASGLDLAQ